MVGFSMTSCYLKNLLPQFSNLIHNNSRGVRNNTAQQVYPNSNRLGNRNMVLLGQLSSINRRDMDVLLAPLQQAYSISMTLKVLVQQPSQQQQAQRPGMQQATSFADKAKGGYQSPYDPAHGSRQAKKKTASSIIAAKFCESNIWSSGGPTKNIFDVLIYCTYAYKRAATINRYFQPRILHRPEDQEQQVAEQVCHLLSQVGPVVS